MGNLHGCVGCGDRRALSEGTPVVRGGRVLVLCPRCRNEREDCQAPPPFEARASERRAEVAPLAPTARVATESRPGLHRRLAPLAASLGALALTGSMALPSFGHSDSSDRLHQDELVPSDSELEASVHMRPFERPKRHSLAVVQIGDYSEELTWYHPIAGQRRMPEKATRRFGAFRDGGREECGEGHCGVDLGGIVGTQIHAVRPGQVERIVRADDAKGGRYVKLRHDHGLVSYYMHLDSIHPELEVGMELAAGEALGTLGDSGIKRSAPHLHLQIAFGEKGEREIFVDPEEMLSQAILLEEDAPW